MNASVWGIVVSFWGIVISFPNMGVSQNRGSFVKIAGLLLFSHYIPILNSSQTRVRHFEKLPNGDP